MFFKQTMQEKIDTELGHDLPRNRLTLLRRTRVGPAIEGRAPCISRRAPSIARFVAQTVIPRAPTRGQDTPTEIAWPEIEIIASRSTSGVARSESKGTLLARRAPRVSRRPPRVSGRPPRISRRPPSIARFVAPMVIPGAPTRGRDPPTEIAWRGIEIIAPLSTSSVAQRESKGALPTSKVPLRSRQGALLAFGGRLL